MPWSGSKENEVNVALTIERNLPLARFSFGGAEGWAVIGTRHSSTILDESFAERASDPRSRLRLGVRHIAATDPRVADLEGLADALIGADAWQGRILTIDWRRALLTVHTEMPDQSDMGAFRWHERPAIPIEVDGRTMTALIDTGSPDALTVPGTALERRRGRVTVAGATHQTDIVSDPRVTEPRIGNRILASYLLQINYQRQTVRLWPY